MIAFVHENFIHLQYRIVHFLPTPKIVALTLIPLFLQGHSFSGFIRAVCDFENHIFIYP